MKDSFEKMFSDFMAEENLSSKVIKEQCNLNEDQDDIVEKIIKIMKAGFSHGLQGWYEDYEFGSDADWAYGVGDDINKLEEQLGFDDGGIFEYYLLAHSAGFSKHLDFSPDDEYLLFVALMAMVKDVHCGQDNLTEAQWEKAEKLFSLLEERINNR